MNLNVEKTNSVFDMKILVVYKSCSCDLYLLPDIS